MSEPLPFTYQPQCIKCGEYRCNWKLLLLETTAFGDPERRWIGDPYVLEMTCQRCGFEWTMRTLDYIGE